MRITKLELQNIGVFEHLMLDFPEKRNPDKAEIHIFTGENGTGKSTILYALGIGRDKSDLLSHRFRYKDEKSGIETLYLHESSDIARRYFFKDNATFSINTVEMSNLWDDYLYHKSSKPVFSFAFFAYSGYRKVIPVDIQVIEEIKEHPLENSTDFDKSVNPNRFVQWLANTKTKEALELIKNGSGQPERYRKAIQRIEHIVSEIIEKKVEFVMETDPLGISIRIENQDISLDGLPDGLKSIISWIGDLLMRMDRIKWATDVEVFDRNFILFLDEIEVHLHPAWQRKILPVVQKLFRNAQIFISTHSPFVVGSVDDAWVYKLELEENSGNARLASGFPILSNSGKSYQLVLDEVFGIESEFSEKLETEMEEFYKLREELLHKDFSHESQFLEKATQLADKSPEVRDIIGREIRQLNRLLQKDYTL